MTDCNALFPPLRQVEFASQHAARGARDRDAAVLQCYSARLHTDLLFLCIFSFVLSVYECDAAAWRNKRTIVIESRQLLSPVLPAARVRGAAYYSRTRREGKTALKSLWLVCII